MIVVMLNKRDFEYDIYSLVRAFYPGVDVSVKVLEETAQPEESSGAADFFILIDYGEDRIGICFEDGQQKVLIERDSAVDGYADRKKTKNCLKSLLYEMLSEYTGQKLPWGNLTGIRPTKIPMALLEAGWKNTEIADYMRKTYFTSSEKTALAIMIANREKHILENIHYADGYSLYIGIPFCPSICLYCSFSSSPISVWKDRVDTYLDALCREIAFGA